MVSRIARLMLRLPEDLHEQLKLRAQSEHRSLNAQIVHLLWLSMSPPAVQDPQS